MLFVLNLIAALHTRVEDAKDRGATATEYAILIVGIALIVAVGAAVFGGALSDWFKGLGKTLKISS